MTTKQKQNIARFKAVQAEAKKLKAKNKKLTHIQAVKQAWAILYSKERKSPVKKKVGALPIGFKGKFFDIPFKIVNQYDIYNDVQAILEDTNSGSTIVIFDGKGSASDKSNAIINYLKKHSSESIKDIESTKGRLLKFSTLMNKEVKDYNAGKKQTIKKQPLVIEVKKSTSIKKPKVIKIKKSSTKKSSTTGSKKLTYVGVRKLQSGASRYEYKLAGIGSNIIDKLKKVEEDISLQHKIYNDYVNAKLWAKRTKNKPAYTQYMYIDIPRVKKYISELKKHKAELKKLL